MSVFERSNIVTENCVHCDRPYSHHNIDGKCLNHPGDIATECYATRKTTAPCGSFHARMQDSHCDNCGWHASEHDGVTSTAAATNPKDALGAAKVPLSLVPPVAIIHAAEAFRDGVVKHGGAYNWRQSNVKASSYVDAAMRHILSWFDGEDHASDSGVHHLGHAIADLAIILDAYEAGSLEDDRPEQGRAADLLDSLHREREAEEKAAEHDLDLELDDEIPF